MVSDGTRVLGLGDIGPEASMPVMEGKALLFKYLGGVDAFPICVDTRDPDELIDFVLKMQPSLGGINLEDISQPKCFHVLDTLREKGNGHPLEIIAEVDDIGAYYDLVKSRGVNMVAFDGTPLSEEEKAQLISTTGERIAYFPQDVSCGMTIEIFERGPKETSALHKRDNS